MGPGIKEVGSEIRRVRSGNTSNGVEMSSFLRDQVLKTKIRNLGIEMGSA